MKILNILILGCVLNMAASLNTFAGEKLRLLSGDITLNTPKISLFALEEKKSTHFVIQFKNKITAQNHENLLKSKIRVFGYLPDDALIVKANAEQIKLAQAMDSELSAFSPYYPEWKMEANMSFSENSEQKILFHIRTLDSDETLAVEESLKLMSEVKILASHDQSVLVECAPHQIQAISRIEGIEWIQLLPVFQTLMVELGKFSKIPGAEPPTYTGYETGTKVMNFDAAYLRGFNGLEQTVAIADTGVDSGDLKTLHKDLAQVSLGYPMGKFNTVWEDPIAHGTHVAGSIVGNGAASQGNLHGGAPGAHLIAEGMWNSSFNGLLVEPDFEKLMGTPFSQGARVHSNSWGAPNSHGAYDNFAASADDIMWKHPELLVVFAAGNDGADLDGNGKVDENTVSSPGSAKNVLTVGASENHLLQGGIQKKLCDLKDGKKKWGVEPLCSDTVSNNPNGIAAFSSRGPTKDGRLKPDLVAPGTNIVSVRSQLPGAGKLWGEYNADYLYSGGTSMATPLTAGAAAVARDYLIHELKIKEPSAALLKATLMHSAKDLYPGQYGTGPTQELDKHRPNVHEGYGRVDMDRATRLGTDTLFEDQVGGVGLGEEFTKTVALQAGESLHATLVYTDAPAKASAAKALINDLDLVIKGPDKSYALEDRVNNTEMLELENLPAGNYEVTVKGINVPQGKNGKQPFALLISHSVPKVE